MCFGKNTNRKYLFQHVAFSVSPETVTEWAKALMNMLTRITSRVNRIEQQLGSPELELKTSTSPHAQPEDAQQTIYSIPRLQETIAHRQKQLRMRRRGERADRNSQEG